MVFEADGATCYRAGWSAGMTDLKSTDLRSTDLRSIDLDGPALHRSFDPCALRVVGLGCAGRERVTQRPEGADMLRLRAVRTNGINPLVLRYWLKTEYGCG